MKVKERNEVIRNRHQAGETVPALAADFNLDTLIVDLIVANLVDYDPAYDDSAYDARTNKCMKCGSTFDAAGEPSDCAGDCEVADEYYYVRERRDTPQELDFNED